MFSAAGGAVIALGDKQAGCNNIINLLTTTEERASFLYRLCHPSVYSRTAASFINSVVTQRPLCMCVCVFKGAFVKVVKILGSFSVPKVKLVLTGVIET